MRLTRKLLVAFVIGVTALLSLDCWVSLQRESAMFDADLRGDTETVGRLLAGLAARLWIDAGEKEARAVVDGGQLPSGMSSRWVWLDNAASELTPVRDGQTVHTEHPDRSCSDTLIAGSQPAAALEVCEHLAVKRAYLRTTVRNAIVLTLVLAAVCGVAATAVGVVWVGRPTRLLVSKARRAGGGDFGEPLVLRQHDELGELARELNAMCDQLTDTQAKERSAVEARIAAVDQLRHAERLATVGRLASGIAHELGTPLNVITGRAEMIEAGDVAGEAARTSARIIGEQGARLTRIIRQIMDYARRGESSRQRRDVRAVVGQAASMLQPLARKHEVKLTVDAGEEPLPGIVDDVQLGQAVTNLVVNGLQATPPGGSVTVAIARVSAAPPGAGARPAPCLRISVADTGSGMEPDVAARAFEPFFTTKAAGEGTGLGLAVTQGIVQDHGGWIGLVSQPGRGSTFSLYIPAAVQQ